jgi:glycosyltransferase involved in cell wall biosynthesis
VVVAALVLPIQWLEPFGLVMIEAMACGTPVLAWRNGSVPEVVEDGVTGFVRASTEELARAVDRVGELDPGRIRPGSRSGSRHRPFSVRRDVASALVVHNPTDPSGHGALARSYVGSWA